MDDIERKLEEFGRDAANVRMTAAEKDARRAGLMAFMEKAVHLPPQKLPRKSLARIFWSKVNPAYVAAPLMVLGLGTGVVFAAENSLPGDLLYPVKTQVIEKVQTSFATTPKAKADLHAKLALKRLEEAEKVAQKRKLNDEQIEDLGVHFDQSNKDLEDALQELKTAHDDQSAEEISTKFSQKLESYRPVLHLIQTRRAVRKALREGKNPEVNVAEGAAVHESRPAQEPQQVDVQIETARPKILERMRSRLQDTLTHEAEM